MTAKIFSKDLRLAAHPMMYVFALFGVMLIIRNYNKELIINSLDVRICNTVFHWKCCQITAAEARSFSTCQCKQVTFFNHISDVTGM